ncbi:sensor histidine kinase [Chiayiivirga flava]|uniref:histidine kinase n=1 Tax=Chiayiivirga flava TaxID=659595 RepID=A0A7W8DA71_9GAMM|nr:sensor histidine kinase [Chiayiivirga flava]MBB5208983.1 two-component system sensor histidine kinase PilS (NtrC family) [Chiayiivirga flava]
MVDTLYERTAAPERSSDTALRRELYFFTLYRALVAALFGLLAFSQLSVEWIELREPLLARAVAIAYLVLAGVLFLTGRRPRFGLARQVAFGLAADILATTLMLHALAELQTGIALALVVNIAAGAILLSLRGALFFGIGAGVLGLIEYLVGQTGGVTTRNLAEVLMFGAAYVAVTVLGHLLGRQMRESHELAEQRRAEVANLAQLNELIIRRMRTGVLVVDVTGVVHLSNEAAWGLLGQPHPGGMELDQLAPQLARRLFLWRVENKNDISPMAVGKDMPEFVPRFARLSVSNELFVIFLDDTSLMSRRAEELTLTNLGRLSASIAHEIRNPLAAISYSAQLLEESPDIPEADRRLVEIIVNHCHRMNGIIENVLNLSRRERSRPESVDLSQWVTQFVDDYKNGHHLERDELRGVAQTRHLHAMVDPQQLHQVVTALVQNALNHGRLPGEAARVTVTSRKINDTSPPLVEVIDRGPGIPAKVADTIFEPFFTTHEHGTGLGLYIARQLCEANQASLEYVPVAGGGSCFRISLPHAQRLDNLPTTRPRPGRVEG